MKLKPYPEYKESGVEWMESLPKAWEVSPLKYHFKIIGGSTPKSDREEYWDGNITWVTPSDLSKLSSFSIKNSQRKITLAGLNSCGSTLVPAGSIILSTRAPIGSIAYAKEELCTNQGCKSLVPDAKTNSMFYTYLLSISSLELNSRGKGTTFLELSGAELSAFKVAFPSFQDQCSIVRFLDHETAKLDTLISKQKHLIELLQEKRQAIISNAVSKGLNPDVKMKDSGVEWLGMVPQGWNVKKIKHTSYLKGRVGWKGLTSDEYLDSGFAFLVTGTDFQSKYINWDNCYHVDEFRYEDDPYIKLKNGDLLITKDGTIGKLALVDNLDGCACLNSGIFLVRPINSYITNFLYWVLSSNSFSEFCKLTSVGSTIQHLYQNVFENFSFPVPSIEEQRQIVSFIEDSTRKIDSLIDKTHLSIDLAKEHRAALISSAVTGKIDVRDYADAMEVA